MQMLMSVAVIIQIIAAVAVIILVLLQHGKGADMGAAFGAGASGSLLVRRGPRTSCRVPPLLPPRSFSAPPLP